jgi:hypothetical protein
VGVVTSHNPMGLHCVLKGWTYLLFQISSRADGQEFPRIYDSRAFVNAVTAVFSDVVTCSLLGVYWSFRWTYYLQRHGRRW